MSGKQIVIYRARTAVDAQLLKNVLAEAGIRALVTNEALADGAGTDILGWPSLAQVVVDENDALAARRVAMEFDRQAAEGIAEEPAEPAPEKPPADDWPTCPDCSQRRMTSCLACGTSGTRFPPADPMPGEAVDDSSPAPLMCICPTCDEPFVPAFLPVCEWCGHRFDADAAASENTADHADDDASHRVTMTMLALIGFVVAVVLYFVAMWR